VQVREGQGAEADAHDAADGGKRLDRVRGIGRALANGNLQN
jgi:hypothetical protein